MPRPSGQHASPQARIARLEKELAKLKGLNPTTSTATDQSVLTHGNITGSNQVAGHQLIINHLADENWLRGLFGRAPTPKARREILKQHLIFLHDRHLYADFRGMGVAGTVPLRLELADLYVPLKARVEMPEGETWARDLLSAGRPIPKEDLDVLGSRFSAPQSVAELFSRHPGLVVLGDPGSGKTTFLKHLAVLYATGRGDRSRLPVMVPLAAYANHLAAPPASPKQSLEAFIPAYFRQEGLDDIATEFARALKSGTALVLLDGLDEVKETTLRQSVVKQVETLFLKHHRGGTKFVLTSRIVGYRDVRPNVAGLEECTLVDFDDEDIRGYATNWIRAVEKAEKGVGSVAALDSDRRRDELLAAVSHNPGVRRLAANPLLLTILCLMQKSGLPLPDRRAELYAQCLKTMLSTWNVARSAGRTGLEERDAVQTLKTLGPLAYWMHAASDGVGLVKHGDLQAELKRILLRRAIDPRAESQATRIEGEEAERAAREFLRDVREHCGVLLERGQGRYGFIHLTFEEYLAGVGLVMQEEERDADGRPGGIASVCATASKLSETPTWREPILLSVGYLGLVQTRESAASEIVNSLLKHSAAAAVLAGDAVVDVGPGGVGRSCVEEVRKRMAALMSDVGVAVVTRAGAGRVRGLLGDDRRGVGTRRRPEGANPVERPDFSWCGPDPRRPSVPYPAGSFRMGGDPKAFQSSDESFLCNRIRQPFFVSRFLVTVAQYQLFLQGTGYGMKSLWTEEGWRWRNGEADTSTWPDWIKEAYGRTSKPISGPEGYHPAFQTPNHPRVGVSWFEAQAFCTWLNSTYPPEELGMLQGWRVALPTEAQWQRVARWPNSPEDRHVRCFPWGDLDSREELSRRCNWHGAELGQTSAVGLFSPDGDSAAGIADLSGNVWEWSLSRFRSTNSPENQTTYNTAPDLDHPEGDSARVLRGGSWGNVDPSDLRAACRYYIHPANRDNLIGFRVVCVDESR